VKGAKPTKRPVCQNSHVGAQVVRTDKEVVVGRHGELAELSKFVSAVQEHFSALVLRGGPGIGKTTLWRRAAAMAQDAGVTVLSTRPSAAEVALSFSGLSDLLDGAGDDVLASVPTRQRRAVEIALQRRDEDDAGVDRLALSSGVLSVLKTLAGASPLLLAVDDLQWLDQATASVLGFALRRLEGLRVGLLACYRAGAAGSRSLMGPSTRPAMTVLEAVSPQCVSDLELGPLSLADTEQVIRSKLPRQLPHRAEALAAAASEGNPFYAIEIARESLRSGEIASPGAIRVPGRLREILTGELGRLPAQTRHALLLASCLAAPTRALIGPAALGAAEEAGFVRVEKDGRILFTHPLMRAAVYESVSGKRRRATHRALASRVDDPEERARHLALAADGPDDEVACELEEAAKIAYARGSPAAAAELTDLALQVGLGEGRPGRTASMVRGANFYFQAGDFTRAQEMVEDALRALPGGTERARALRLLALVCSRRGSFGKAVDLAAEAIEASANEPVLTAELELDLVFYLTMQGNPAEAIAHARQAVQLAKATGLDAILAEGLAVLQMQSFLLGQGLSEEDLVRSLALEDRSRDVPAVLRPRLIAGLLWLWTDRPSEARTILEELYADAVDSGRESDLPGMASYLAWACLWSGDVERAASLADEAQRTAEQLEDWFLTGTALFIGALVRACTGEAGRARADSVQALRIFERLQFVAGMTWASWALGLAELSLGNSAGAEAALAPLSAVLSGLPSVDPAVAVFVPDEVEALIDLGSLDKAQLLTNWFERQAQAAERLWALAVAARCRGLLLAERGDSTGALEAFEAALALHATTEVPLEKGRTLLALGRLQRRCKRRRQARQALEAALDLFSQVGATLWAAKAQAELSRVAGHRAASGLTETERNIARLAADGLTNKVIAQRCFVTVKTVEANLTRVYRKLGVASRTQLARVLETTSPSGYL
jgi:DNA-binding NarL/FixJ family response regulator